MPRNSAGTLLAAMMVGGICLTARGATDLSALPADLAAKTTVLIDAASPLQPGAAPADGRLAVVDAAGQPFTTAQHVEVLRQTPNPWDVQLVSPPTTAPIHRGDVLLVVCRARCLASASESGGGRYEGYLQLSHQPWTSIAHFSGRPGPAWQTEYAAATAAEDQPTGQAMVALHLGLVRQTLEVGGVAVLDLGPGVDVHRLPYTTLTYAGREADAPWRAQAAARIEKYRKADLTVRVVDSAGQPIANAAVHVRLCRHAYGFGTFLEEPALWNNPDGEQYRAAIARMFNRVTVPLYWADWGWADPQSRRRFLALAAWAHDHDLQIRGHNLVWPSWRNMPTALRQVEHDPAGLRAAVLEHIREVVTTCEPFGFREYDVINEPRAEHDLMDLLGKSVMVDWFKAARGADPAPLLGLNDYQILSAGGETEPQQRSYLDTARYLLDHGAPLGVIGFQSHMSEDLTPPARVVQILDRFAALGLPLQATEYDLPIGDEQTQADYTRDFLTAFFSEPATTAFTMWGFWEGQQWQPQAALIGKDWTLKPAGQAYLQLVTQTWWTDVHGTTAPDGSFHTRGFLGNYDVTVTNPAGTSRTIVPEVLDKGGTTVTATVRQ